MTGGSLGWPPGFAASRVDREAALVLSALRGITPRGMLEVAQIERTSSAVLERIRAGGAGSDADRAAARALRPDAIAESVRACGGRFVVAGDREYPPQLEQLADPPLGLYLRGRPLGPFSAMVSIVGARACTEVGRELARELGRAVAAAGLAVVSGAARGIDTASHEGALSAGGVTVAVLGCGIDAPVGSSGRRLIRRILERGTVAGEYPPGVPPDAFRFPARNRIVAALSRALVVVEGTERSGSLISAEHALELGRDVYAVPGLVTSPLSAAPHRLIREGAGLIRGPDDLLGDLGVRALDRAQAAFAPELSASERAAFDAIVAPTLPERIARQLGVDVPRALAILLGLEMKGLVRSVGGRFERRFPSSRELGR